MLFLIAKRSCAHHSNLCSRCFVYNNQGTLCNRRYCWGLIVLKHVPRVVKGVLIVIKRAQGSLSVFERVTVGHVSDYRFEVRRVK